MKTVKLNRLFNIFNPSVYRWSVFLALILLVWGICLIASRAQSVTVTLGIVAVCLLLNTVDRLLHYPKAICTDGTRIEFDDYVNLRPRYRHGNGYFWLKVSYSVSEIQAVEFHQNAIEKMLDVGHISFSGKATFTAKRDLDRIEEKERFVIYGIRAFSQFQNDFSNK